VAGEHIDLPRAPVRIGGKGWSQNVPCHYLSQLLRTLRKEKKVQSNKYGKGRKPRWYPKDLDWSKFKPGTKKLNKEDATNVVESILKTFGYDSAIHYDGWEEDRRIARERRDEEDRMEREREDREERERVADRQERRDEEDRLERERAERERVLEQDREERKRVAEQNRQERERRWEEAQMEPNYEGEEDGIDDDYSDDGEDEFLGEDLEGYEKEEYTQDHLNNTEVNFQPPSSRDSISAAAADTDAESPAAAESSGLNRPKRTTTGACLSCNGRTGDVRTVPGLGPLCWDCRQDQ
jgi:hypothetical protein